MHFNIYIVDGFINWRQLIQQIMKHITLALATVMLPVASYAYKAVPLCNKVLKIGNEKLESSTIHSKDYCSFSIPPGTERLIFHIGLNERNASKPVHLLNQLQEKLEAGAPIYVIGCMVDSKPSEARISMSTFDNVMCAAMFARDERDQCRPLIWQTNSTGGTYDVQVLPIPYAGEYYICFKNQSDAPHCYATIEAVAIVH